MQISLEQSRSFAALSGDFNFQHLDPVRARRLIFGSTVVHGIHLVMLALDTALAQAAQNRALVALQAVFSAPVPTGARFFIEAGDCSKENGSLVVKLGDRAAASIDVAWTPSHAGAKRPPIADQLFTPAAPVDRTIHEVAALERNLPLWAARGILSSLFPRAAAHLPVDQIAVLLAITRMVGMECPGTNSILAALRLEFTPPPSGGSPALRFTITKARPGLGVSITVDGPGVRGQIHALFRPTAAKQPSINEVRSRVPRGSFAGQRALIIGGSRGLGELSAKILAAGGGEVSISYAQGKGDAARVVSEILGSGGAACAFALDVASTDGILPKTLLGAPHSHLYYFATPRVEPSRMGDFDVKKFELYCRFYVAGLDRLLSQLLQDRLAPLTLFNPSTVFLDVPDARFAEYAAAKAASEALCGAYRMKLGSGLHVHVPRLARLKTDQTAALHGDEPPDGLDALLAVLPRGAGSDVQ